VPQRKQGDGPAPAEYRRKRRFGRGHVTFDLDGRKLHGRFSLTRMREVAR
jgi:hypothetical protein